MDHSPLRNHGTIEKYKKFWAIFGKPLDMTIDGNMYGHGLVEQTFWQRSEIYYQ